ncbi:Histone H4-like protein [Mycena kentingensis (nom. inval.)]|nr:Histone H4-like protein [Mycena kentingensis (nom. inval.)]
MSGRGKGGKGFGRGGAKSCCRGRRFRDNLADITRPSMRRLTRRGGAKRTSTLIYEETRGVLRGYLEGVVRDAVLHTSHGWRTTITREDVTRAVQMSTGRVLYAL